MFSGMADESYDVAGRGEYNGSRCAMSVAFRDVHVGPPKMDVAVFIGDVPVVV